ncbi:maleylacetoacetate isomerase [Legionella waltersii]|uniref:Glutathione S-transferase n=1 Tax=Legionella waltersii TaxID=66969 RepID=A0A0W1A034_9GAMM|nr:maleylacetoacetate isomerase [Legionella waltersii]KTD74703.1 glutathione S-transferase [Legionella waltersii]SNV09313.1 maleylacetoacetate isomerase [Legionella waltersii]
MILYDYFRSTACYRVRIALNLKQIPYEKVEVHLVNNGGEQHSPMYLKINPQGLVPTIDNNGQVISQSLAIIDYLEDVYPDPQLLPKDPYIKAKLKSIAFTVACDMHPLNNLGVLNRLKSQFNAQEDQVTTWYHHWLKKGFDAIEKQLEQLERSQAVCYGDTISLADVCLIPQVYNAYRFHFNLDAYPLIRSINEHCLSIEAFKKAVP